MIDSLALSSSCCGEGATVSKRLTVDEGKVHIMVMYMLVLLMFVLYSLDLQPLHYQTGSDWRTIQVLSELLKQHCDYLLANQLHTLQMPH